MKSFQVAGILVVVGSIFVTYSSSQQAALSPNLYISPPFIGVGGRGGYSNNYNYGRAGGGNYYRPPGFQDGYGYGNGNRNPGFGGGNGGYLKPNPGFGSGGYQGGNRNPGFGSGGYQGGNRNPGFGSGYSGGQQGYNRGRIQN